MKNNKYILYLFTVALIWGGGVNAMKYALNSGLSSGQLNMVRGLIFTCLMLAFFRKKIFSMSKATLKNGIFAGVFNFLAFVVQAYGAQYTTPSKSRFFVSTGVIMIPFIVWILRKTKPKKSHIISALICLAGMVILSGITPNDLSVNKGDIIVIAAAFFTALSMIVLADAPRETHFSQSAFCLAFTLFLGSFVYVALFERSLTSIHFTGGAVFAVLYLSCMSNFAAQNLQVIAQQHVHPYIVSLITSLQGFFGTIISIIIGFESFQLSVVIGGAVILISLALSGLGDAKKDN